MTKLLLKNKIPDLSIVILNFNSGEYLKNCLKSINSSNLKKYSCETIVVDNASTDHSIALARSVATPATSFLLLSTNLGFAAGNNRGIKIIHPESRYVLFLNPDTTVESDTLSGMIEYLDNNQNISAATCYVKLALTGQLQPECHRAFPTPLNAFLHFSGISSRQYFMEYLDYTKVQKIDCCVGAFLMLRRRVGEAVGWWNEKYFFYGEDLDLCYQLKQHGFNLYFIPDYKITHFQGISSGIKKTKSLASRETKVRSAHASTQAMRIFYENNLLNDYSPFLRPFIMTGIKCLENYRVLKAKYL